MTKNEVIALLEAAGIDHDKSAKKADLEKLLPAAAGRKRTVKSVGLGARIQQS